ncbi:unnamed protein product [Amoebophrya sp. A120]|nr:unnamed protein product [Amoebophrya sp. A120]|eukprot:GSA120T00021167001.1
MVSAFFSWLCVVFQIALHRSRWRLRLERNTQDGQQAARNLSSSLLRPELRRGRVGMHQNKRPGPLTRVSNPRAVRTDTPAARKSRKKKRRRGVFSKHQGSQNSSSLLFEHSGPSAVCPDIAFGASTSLALRCMHITLTSFLILFWNEPRTFCLREPVKQFLSRKRIFCFCINTADPAGATHKTQQSRIEHIYYFPGPGLRIFFSHETSSARH